MDPALNHVRVGGDTIVVDVAPPAGVGIDELLESILLVAEVEELTANPKVPARALVLEAPEEEAPAEEATPLVKEADPALEALLAEAEEIERRTSRQQPHEAPKFHGDEE